MDHEATLLVSLRVSFRARVQNLLSKRLDRVPIPHRYRSFATIEHFVGSLDTRAQLLEALGFGKTIACQRLILAVNDQAIAGSEIFERLG